jgi:hypothetical protein
MSDHEDEGTMMFGESKRRDVGYTIWKEIVGTMIGIAPFAIAFFLWMSSVQTRLAVLEEARTSQSYRDTAQDASLNASIARIETAQTEVKLAVRDLEKYMRDNTIRR